MQGSGESRRSIGAGGARFAKKIEYPRQGVVRRIIPVWVSRLAFPQAAQLMELLAPADLRVGRTWRIAPIAGAFHISRALLLLLALLSTTDVFWVGGAG